MTIRFAAILFAVAALPLFAEDAPPTRPRTGPVQIMPLDQVKPGMKGTAWTVFQGTEPEPVPVEIIGRWKNQLGPNQDVILAKMGGKATRTYVAGGMSGSPVYVDGKLIGAVSLRVGQFSVDPICGITPIEQMLDISEFDKSIPADAKTPDRLPAPQTGSQAPAMAGFGAGQPLLMPIEAPLSLSGFTADTLRQFAPAFERMGFTTVAAGGAAAPLQASKPAPGWEQALNPGEAVAGVLVNGDMSVTGLGTVTYNDGKRVLAFGHSLFDLGPVDMPMSSGEVLLTLASPLQPNKLANATQIVGALRQDRHSGVEGKLGQESQMIPVTVKIRSLGANESVLRERNFHFNVFVHEKYTPYLMTLTLYNCLSELNEFAAESTYRLNGQVAMKGESNISVSTMESTGQGSAPAPMALANWWGEKFNRLYLNNVKTPPDVRGVNVTVDLLSERRLAIIENAWLGNPEVRAGDDVPVKVLLRPYRGEPIIREFNVHIPVGLSKGDHRIVLSDAGVANRMQNMAVQANRFMDIPETVSLINQERSNNELYVSLVQSSPTAYDEDKTLPSLPGSALNLMQSGRAPSRSLVTSPETTVEQTSLPFDSVVTGSYSLRIRVK